MQETTIAQPSHPNQEHKRNHYISLGLLCIFISFHIISCTVVTQPENYKDKVIMGIFAHPDDETSSGAVLAKYARKGAKVIIVIATDGRLGVTDLTDYKAEDELADLRREEMQCAADILGAELHHMRYHDQLRMTEGQDEFIQESRRLLDELHEIIDKVQPDIIITHGPDGGSNHLDHRIVSASVTQVILSKNHEKMPALFYFGDPVSALGDLWKYRGVHDDFLTVRDYFTDEDVDVAKRSALCHASQFTQETVENRAAVWRERGYAYFRPFEMPRGKADGLFNYIVQVTL